MAEKNCAKENCGFKEAVCIHTDKVYDSCRDKDCARLKCVKMCKK